MFFCIKIQYTQSLSTVKTNELVYVAERDNGCLL